MDKFIPACPECQSTSVRFLRAIPVKQDGTQTWNCRKCNHVFEAKPPEKKEEKKVDMITFSCLHCEKSSEAPRSQFENGEATCKQCGSFDIMETIV